MSDKIQLTCSLSFLYLLQENYFTKEQVKEAEKTQTNTEIATVLKDNSEVDTQCVSSISRNLAPCSGAPNDNFRKNICSEDDLRSRIFGTFVVKFLACLPFLGFWNF